MADSIDEVLKKRIANLCPRTVDMNAIRPVKTAQRTVLRYVVDAAMVKYIIRKGVDSNVRTFQTHDTPLIFSIRIQSPLEVIEQLLISGADLNIGNINENTPLNVAANVPKCNIEIVKILLAHKADVNISNEFHDTPLINAVRNFSKSMDLIKILLEAGASVNITNLNGETPLLTALKNDKCTMELLNELFRYKANVNCKDIKGNTPLHCAIKYLTYNKFKITKELIKQGCDVNVRNSKGDTPLICAIYETRYRGNETFWKCFTKYTVLKNSDKYSEMIITHGKVMSKKVLNYISACQEEVDFMKKDIIDEISMYDFILSKTVQTTSFDKLFETLKKKPYRIYNDLIVKKAKKVSLFNLLSEHGLYTYKLQENTMLKIRLDWDSTIKICSYLEMCELENLVNAYCIFKEMNGLSSSRQLKRPAEEILDVIQKPRVKPKERKQMFTPSRKCKLNLLKNTYKI